MAGPKEPIIKHYEENPILTKHDVPYPVETLHNAIFAAFRIHVQHFEFDEVR